MMLVMPHILREPSFEFNNSSDAKAAELYLRLYGCTASDLLYFESGSSWDVDNNDELDFNSTRVNGYRFSSKFVIKRDVVKQLNYHIPRLGYSLTGVLATIVSWNSIFATMRIPVHLIM